MRLAARVVGVGLAGPGLSGWGAARDILAGRAPYAPGDTIIPSPEALPPTERRRAGKTVKLSLAVGLEAAAEAGIAPAALGAVFASSSGDPDNCHALCEVLASEDRSISPTRFHNSVHNAPAGYWGIATGATASADCVAAFDGSFGAGLVEALGRIAVQRAQPLVLVAYDAPYPEPLHAARPIPYPFAVALVLAAAGDGPAIEATLVREAPQPMDDAGLEAVRRAIPSARALPLLALLAAGNAGSVTLEYLDDLSLRVEVGR